MCTNCNKKYVFKVSALTSKGDKGDTGPQGPPGNIDDILPLSSDDILYNGQSLTEVLDGVLYQALVINSFTSSPINFEIGTILTSLSMSWSYNKTVQSQTITGTGVVPPTLLVGDRTKVVTLSNVAVDTVITLTADDVTGDEHISKTRTHTIRFLPNLYWGISTIPGVYNSAFVNGLSNKQLSTSKAISFTAAPGEDQYIFLAIPTAYGIPTFKTNGFNGGLELVATFSHTNEAGNTQNYNLFKTENPNLGTTLVEAI